MFDFNKRCNKKFTFRKGVILHGGYDNDYSCILAEILHKNENFKNS